MASWQRFSTDDGDDYYYQPETEETVWEKPAGVAIVDGATGEPISAAEGGSAESNFSARAVRVEKRGGENGMTAAKIAVRVLLVEETWIAAGNKRGAKGGNGTAVGKVRQAISEEPRGGGVGAGGLTGTLNLGSTGLRALPPQLGTQTKLKKLYLGGNPELGELPPEIGALTELTVLRLSETAVSSLPVEAKQLTKLERLSWFYSKAPNATVRIPAAFFEALPRNCTTDFEHTRVAITGAPGGMDVVVPTALTDKGIYLKNRAMQDFLAAFRGSAAAARPRWLRAMVVGMADAGKTTLVGRWRAPVERSGRSRRQHWAQLTAAQRHSASTSSRGRRTGPSMAPAKSTSP
jgi:hypothetical protein